MTKQKTQVLLLMLFVAVIAAVRFTPLKTAVTFENVKQHRDALLVFVQENYWTAVASYIAVYVVLTAFPLPAGLVLTLAGGFLFGTAPAVLYINVGASVGGTLSFLSARYLLGNRLQEKYRQQLERFNDEMRRNGVHYLLTLRFIPVFPFFMVNFLAGLTRVPLKTFVWTMSLGIIPASTVFAFAGRQIGTINSPADILTPRMMLAFAVLGVFTLLPVVWKRFRGGSRERRS